MKKLLFALGATLFLAGCATDAPENADTMAEAAATAGSTALDYDNMDYWLCRPGRDGDACDIDLTTTIVGADGSLTREPFSADPDADIDCFYVYPTVSNDATPNSDTNPGPGETSVIAAQFARFAEVCKPYAPLYRQVTLTALRDRMSGGSMQADREMGYNDVKAAWEHYLENDNNGRGVVLVGHSQGSGVLTQLLAAEIDGKPVQDRVISALLIGTRFAVPEGDVVGGALKHMPLCTRDDETGCVVTFASFRSTVPPPAMSLFGRMQQPGMIAACNNPADLGGGEAELHAYLSAGGPGVSAGSQPAWAEGKTVDTPFVSVPGLLSAQCVNNERGSYLEVTVNGDPADPRADDISGDVITNGEVQAGWGLHLIDVHLVMGDLIDLVERQSVAYRSK